MIEYISNLGSSDGQQFLKALKSYRLKIGREGWMVPVTDRLNNFEHWTARGRRLRFLQWRNSSSSSSSSSSSNSYEEFRLFECIDRVMDRGITLTA